MNARDTAACLETATPESFRSAMALWASGVTVVTTADALGRPQGFTASAFCSASMEPPLVLVCLTRSAACFQAFAESDAFAVHVLGERQQELAARFARKGADKFAGLATTSGVDGVPLLPDVLARLECRTVDRLAVGDHLALLGEVADAATGDGEPLLYYRRAFQQARRHS